MKIQVLLLSEASEDISAFSFNVQIVQKETSIPPYLQVRKQ
jgi:hypothetical protein